MGKLYSDSGVGGLKLPFFLSRELLLGIAMVIGDLWLALEKYSAEGRRMIDLQCYRHLPLSLSSLKQEALVCARRLPFLVHFRSLGNLGSLVRCEGGK